MSERALSADVLDHGSVELISGSEDGNDLSVVNAARVSFAAKSEVLDGPAKGLIRFLMRNGHGTPFEHNSFTWRIKLPIFVAREWQRHRMGSFNEQSARYSVLQPQFYVPEPEDMRTQVGKPGEYTFEPLERTLAEDFANDMRIRNEGAFQQYQTWLDMGLAKEVARTILPVATYTEMWWTVNARSLMAFLELRTSEHAQLEIRRYAQQVERIWSNVMPETHAAWVEFGRRKP